VATRMLEGYCDVCRTIYFCLNIFIYVPSIVKQVATQLLSETQYLMAFVFFSDIFKWLWWSSFWCTYISDRGM